MKIICLTVFAALTELWIFSWLANLLFAGYNAANIPWYGLPYFITAILAIAMTIMLGGWMDTRK